MLLRQVITPGLAIHSYIVADQVTKEAVVVDPPRTVEPLLAAIEADGLRVTHILETHVHADFVSGAKELQQRLGYACAIVCSALGGPEWTPRYADEQIKDRESIRVGSLRFEARHTPGHTPEHISWLVFDEARDAKDPWVALTGDFLFVGSLGRPDLLGPDATSALAKQMYHTVKNVLPEWPDFIEIYPGHGAGSLCARGIGTNVSSTLGYERRANAALKPLDEKQWCQEQLKDLPRFPAYFSRIKQINVAGAPLKSQLAPPKPFTAQQFLKLNMNDIQLCDVREVEDFSAHHAAGSMNLPVKPAFPAWAAELLSPSKPLVLVVKDASALPTVLNGLSLVGLDEVEGYLVLDDKAIRELGDRMTSLPLIAPAEAAKSLKDKKGHFTIVDVRTPGEWKQGHIADAVPLELAILPEQLNKLPRDQALATICHSGARASIAASILRKAGFRDVSNIRGGMEGWVKSGQATVKK